jgi:hypothetical protein
MENIRLGAPAPDATLVQLLLRWADEGRRGTPPQRLTPAPTLLRTGSSSAAAHTTTFSLGLGPADTVELSTAGVAVEGVVEDQNATGGAAAGKRASTAGQLNGGLVAGDVGDSAAHVHKRPRLLDAAPDGAGVSSSLLSRASTGLHMSGGADAVSPKGAAQHMQTEAGITVDGHAAAEGPLLGVAQQLMSAPTSEPPTIVLLPPSDSSAGATTAPTLNGAGGSQHCHHLLPSSQAVPQEGSEAVGLQRNGTASPSKPKPGASKFNPIDHIFQFHHALRQELRQLEADALQVEVALQQGSQTQQGVAFAELDQC